MSSGPLGPLGGDSFWRAPGGELLIDALGEAARYADPAAWRADLAAACRCGEPDLSPLGFFTLPPAGCVESIDIRLPAALLRRDAHSAHSAHGASLLLSARRGSENPHVLVERWQMLAARLIKPQAAAPHPPASIIRIDATPDADTWQARVRATRDTISAGRFTKAVLARRLKVTLSARPDTAALARRLAVMHGDCHILVLPHEGGQVIAATPERLVRKQGDVCFAHALAGTARRHGDAASDARSAAALHASAKERREHACVVAAVQERLTRCCASVDCPAEPSLLRLRHVQHLWTKITGRPKPGVDLFDLARALHPTPAVLGLPAQAAAEWLDTLGERRDGLYSGVAGWIDAAGDGDAVVILRAAHLDGTSAVLWAGAGIMAESDPAAELAETELKFVTMLEVLGTAL
jgi:menaquinone-specific isochorismate synthase